MMSSCRRSTKNCSTLLAGTPIYTQGGHVVSVLLPPGEQRFREMGLARHEDAVRFVNHSFPPFLPLFDEEDHAWAWRRVSDHDTSSDAQKLFRPRCGKDLFLKKKKKIRNIGRALL